MGPYDRQMGSWYLQDLTAETGTAPSPTVRPAAYVFEAQGTQHVIYVGSDAHIYELWWG
jgi:hypothetical protein